MRRADLASILESTPLAVSLWSVDPSGFASDRLLGTAHVPIAETLHAERHYRCGKNTYASLSLLREHQEALNAHARETGGRGLPPVAMVHAYDCYVPVFCSDGQQPASRARPEAPAKVASLRTVLFLEDLGPDSVPCECA